LSYLAPGSPSTFTAEFVGALDPDSAEARVSTYLPGNLEETSVATHVGRTFRAEDGRINLLLEINNTSGRPVHLAGLAAVLRDDAGGLQGIAEGAAGLTGVAAGTRTTWLLVGDSSGRAAPASVLTDARPLQTLPDARISLVGELQQGMTDQGLGFVIGEVVNESSVLRWARGIVLLSREGDAVSLAELRSPLPLLPGEKLPFLLWPFPGIEPFEDNWTASFEADSLASENIKADIVQLELEVLQLEQVGSSLFVRGRVHNPQTHAVLRPSVLGSVHSAAGELLSAGWVTPKESLDGSTGVEFRLQLPLPEGLDLSQAEFDFRATAMVPG
jgi:hypothetical protein